MSVFKLSTHTILSILKVTTLASLLFVNGCDNRTSEENYINKREKITQLDTLKKIADSNTIVLGYRDASTPFSYVINKAGNPVGYAQELQLKVVERIKKTLKKPDLKIRYMVITSQNRIPLLTNGVIDIECGSTSNNKKRQEQVAFSYSFFRTAVRLLTPINSGINGFHDLKGKTVAVSSGTTSERLLKKYNTDHAMNIKIIPTIDHNKAFNMLKQQRAQAYMNDDILLTSKRMKAKSPEKWKIVGEPMSFESYGCMLRKDDVAFKKLVDSAIADVYASGEIKTLYKKWFESPIPPNNLNLNFPMTQEIRNILSKPTDETS